MVDDHFPDVVSEIELAVDYQLDNVVGYFLQCLRVVEYIEC